MSDEYRILRNLEAANGALAYSLRVFGDHLAEREGYKRHKGLDAVHFYLVQKHRWLPSVVRAMSTDDLRFTLEEEMVGWTLPKEARDV